MARIKAIADDGTYWYSERGAGPSYVWAENESHASEMPRSYADKRLEELLRVERYRQRDCERPRTIKIVRSRLP